MRYWTLIALALFLVLPGCLSSLQQGTKTARALLTTTPTASAQESYEAARAAVLDAQEAIAAHLEELPEEDQLDLQLAYRKARRIAEAAEVLLEARGIPNRARVQALIDDAVQSYLSASGILARNHDLFTPDEHAQLKQAESLLTDLWVEARALTDAALVQSAADTLLPLLKQASRLL